MNRKTIEEVIKSSGVTDDTEIKKAVDAIMKENGSDITPLKTEIETLKGDIEIQKGVVEAKNNKIKELEEVDLEQIKKDEFEKGKTEGSKEVEQMKFDKAFEKELEGYKVKNKASIMGHLDMSKITVEKDEKGKISKLVGLEEQIKPLQEKEDYLFNFDEKDPSFAGRINADNGNSKSIINDGLFGALKEKYK